MSLQRLSSFHFYKASLSPLSFLDMSFQDFAQLLDKVDTFQPPITQSKKNPFLMDSRELAIDLKLIYDDNARTNLPGKSKDGPDSLRMSIINTVAELVDIPKASIIKSFFSQISRFFSQTSPEFSQTFRLFRRRPICSNLFAGVPHLSETVSCNRTCSGT